MIKVNGKVMKRHMDQMLEAHVHSNPLQVPIDSSPIGSPERPMVPEIQPAPEEPVPERINEPEAERQPDHSTDSLDQSENMDNSESGLGTSFSRPKRNTKPINRWTYK